MPYFKTDNQNLLFIHIPKTGGSSLELYFCDLYKIPLDNKSLCLFIPDDIKLEHNLNINSSLQHLTYQTIMKYKEFFNIDTNNLKILTIVRNPYERIISDLFWHNKIQTNTSKKEVYNIINTYLNATDLDNHNIPQSSFITDSDNQLLKNITIMHTETLDQDMHKAGYVGFNIHVECAPYKKNWRDYLNDNSINKINSFYEDDFKLLNYTIVLPNLI